MAPEVLPLNQQVMCPLLSWQRSQQPATGMGTTSYSIKSEFDGAVVFITGASGYIGSVVVEQLLRTTNVGTIYLLMRPRRGHSIQQRLEKLLQGVLFHKVRDSSKLLQKVKVIAGDIVMPGLGLSPADKALLLDAVDFMIHCAADIRLEADIQETLTANFEGTRTVLELAAAARHLKALVHVSSAFVNMNQPRSSIVDEQVYPLKYGNQVMDVEELSQELMSLQQRDANHRAEVLMKLWDFPNTYTMGKHMSEQLVTRYQEKQQLPVAIVRPSLVSAIAGEPYPGYVGNWAGPIGAGAAMAIGMFDCIESVASQPMGIWDVVPADQVASIILAAAAAVSAGVAAAISRATGSGSIAGTALDTAVVLGKLHPFSPAAQAARLQHQGRNAQTLNATGHFTRPDVAATIKLPEHHNATGLVHKITVDATARGVTSGMGLPAQSDSATMSAAASTSDLSHMTETHSDACSIGSNSSAGGSSPKIRSSQAKHSRGTSKLTQQLLESVTVTAHTCSHTSETDMHSEECTESEGSGEGHSRLPLLIVHAATSTTYPLTLMEGWNYNLDFFDAHPPPFRISFGTLPKMTPDFVPTEANVMACRRRIWWKVWAISALLKLMGREKEAKKLVIGYETFCVHNNFKTDRDLKFSTHALVALEAALHAAEAADFLLVWRPITHRNSGSGKHASQQQQQQQQTHQQQQEQQKRQLGAEQKATATEGKVSCLITAAGSGVLGRSEAALAPVTGDVVWRRYVHTQMAGIYRMLFGVVVDQQKEMGPAAATDIRAETGLAPQSFVQHDFRRIR